VKWLVLFSDQHPASFHMCYLVAVILSGNHYRLMSMHLPHVEIYAFPLASSSVICRNFVELFACTVMYDLIFLFFDSLCTLAVI